MLALVIASIISRDDTIRDCVDLVELNHFYDDNARLVFDQIIFYNWSDDRNRFDVIAWRLVNMPGQVPAPDRGGAWKSMWMDGDKVRAVYAKSFSETWTQHDPELAERDILPKEKRRELRTK